VSGDELRARRVSLGLTQGELAEALRVRASYVSMVERGKRASDDVMARLAAELAKREAASRAGTQVAGFHAAYDHLARLHDLRMERAEISGTIDKQGTLTTIRRYIDCRPTGRIDSYLFRDRIVGDVGTSGQLVIDSSPTGLAIDCTSRSEGGWRVHTMLFPSGGWASDDGPASFYLRTVIPLAYTWDPEEYGRRLRAEGAEATTWEGEFSWYVRYMLGALRISIELPADYAAQWGPCGAWPDLRSHHVRPRNVLDAGVCASHRVTLEANRAILDVVKPLPGYTFSLHWAPPRGAIERPFAS
jgi:transcriptional regulator with XRE-family HTH domain